MIEIFSSKGADYLKFDEQINPDPVVLISKTKLRLEPGMKVMQIGGKKRSQFALKDGLYMIYEGLLQIGNIRYAIFNVPEHNDGTEKIQYRYAFATVIINDILQCFIVGPGGPLGCRDIVMDMLVTYEGNGKEL